MNKLELLFEAVIVKPLEEDDEKMYGFIFIPDAGKDRNEKGTVVAVGPGAEIVGVRFVATTVEIGDVVILPTMGFSKLQFLGEDYYIGNERQILARIKSEEK